MTLSYSSIANFTVQTYQLAVIGQESRQATDNSDMLTPQTLTKQEDRLTRIARADLTNTISQLSNRAYSQLRGQNIEYLLPENTTVETTDNAGSYWGSAETASRIVESAIAITGGNTDKFKIIVDAVQKGFGDAQIAFGGTLPEISLKTREAVFSQLDTWAETSQRPNNYSK